MLILDEESREVYLIECISVLTIRQQTTFLKTVKIFDPPKLENLARNSWSITAEFYDVGLLETLRNALRENDFNEISVEPNEHRGFILKGNISVERFKEAFKIIKEIAPTESIKNEIPNIPKSFLNPSYDPELEKMVNEAIQTKGFRDIIFDSSTIPSTLKGTIPKGQTEEVMKIILKLLRTPVINQMVEK